MAASHFAFGHFAIWRLAGWHFASAGGVLVFAGREGAASIDWQSPVGGVGAPGGEVGLPLALTERTVLGVQAVAASGARDYGRNVLAFAGADQDGALLPAPLAPVVDLCAGALDAQTVLVEFSHALPPACALPEEFELLGDDGSGIDLDSPLATLPTDASGEYSTAVHTSPLPVRIAVRPRAGEHTGPVRTAALTQ